MILGDTVLTEINKAQEDKYFTRLRKVNLIEVESRMSSLQLCSGVGRGDDRVGYSV